MKFNLSAALVWAAIRASAGSPSVAQEMLEDAASVDAGRAGYNVACKSCHSLEAGVTIVGPSLAGIYGRRAGSDPSFKYSDPLLNSAIIWQGDTLNAYLNNPFKMGKEVNMIIHGIRDKKMRADLIAFLKQGG